MIAANVCQLADRNHSVSKAYDVLLPEEGIALRGTFIIDGNGTLRASTVHDLPVGRSVEETLRVIEAFQFTDEHGEVCPAGWEKGVSLLPLHYAQETDIMPGRHHRHLGQGKVLLQAVSVIPFSL